MTLEQQVCSLELAKRLKELGVKQSSYFVWHFPLVNDKQTNDESLAYVVAHHLLVRHASDNWYSAFTVAELGEMLRYGLDRSYHPAGGKNDTEWCCTYWKISESDQALSRHGATEADARAKMACYLIENKLITL